MRVHDEPFCPVCAEEVAIAILSTCAEQWDDALWHKLHPLTEWHCARSSVYLEWSRRSLVEAATLALAGTTEPYGSVEVR